MEYTPELAAEYSQKRELFNETDTVLIENIETIGVADKEVLDLGCGDGRHARYIKGMGASHVTGVDVNKSMIDLAKEKNIDDSDVAFFVADGKNIPLENESVDLVVSNFVIHYFVNAEEVFGEISRVLKDDGYFVGTFNVTDVEEGYEHLFNQQMPIRLGQDDKPVIVQNLIKSRKEIEDAISTSGFKIIKEENLNHPHAVVDDSFADKSHIKKHAVLMVLQKTA